MSHKTLHESAAEILAASMANAGKEPVPMAALAQTGTDLGGEMVEGGVTAVGSNAAQEIEASPKPGRPGVPAEPMKTLSPMTGEGENEEGSEEDSEEDSEQLMEHLIAEHGLDMIVEDLISEYGDEAVFHTLMESAIVEFGEDAVHEKFAETLVEEIGEDKVFELFAESVVREFNEQEFTDEEFNTLQEQSNAFISEMQTLNEEEFENYIDNLTEEELIQAIQLSSLNEEYLVEFFKKLKKLGKKVVKGVKKIGKGVLKVAGKVLSNPIGSALLSFALPGAGSVLGGLASKAVGKLASTGLGKLVSSGVGKLASSALGQGVKKLAGTAIGGLAKDALVSGAKNAVMSKISGGSASQGFKSGLVGGLAGGVGGALGGKVAQLTGSNFAGDLIGNVASTKLAGGGSADVKSAALGSISGGLGNIAQALQARRDARNADATDGGEDDQAQTAAADNNEGEGETRVAAASQPVRRQAQIQRPNAQTLANLARRYGAQNARMAAESTELQDYEIILEGVANNVSDQIEQLDEQSYNTILECAEYFDEFIESLTEEEFESYLSKISEEQYLSVLSLMTINEAARAAGGLMSRGSSRLAASGAKSALKTAGKFGLRALPVLGTAYSLGLAGKRALEGDLAGAGLAAAGALPGPAGWAAIATDLAKGDDIARAGNQMIDRAGGRNLRATARDLGQRTGPQSRLSAAIYGKEGDPQQLLGTDNRFLGNVAARTDRLSSTQGSLLNRSQRSQSQQMMASGASQQRKSTSGNRGASAPNVGTQLASTSGGMFSSRSDRLNQSKVDAVLGKGKYKAGSAAANLALANFYKNNPQQGMFAESTSGEYVMEEQDNYETILAEQAIEFIDHLYTLSEEEMNDTLDQLSDEEANYINSVMEALDAYENAYESGDESEIAQLDERFGLAAAGRAARAARAARASRGAANAGKGAKAKGGGRGGRGGRGGAAATDGAAGAAKTGGLGKYAAAGAVGGAVGYGAGKVMNSASAAGQTAPAAAAAGPRPTGPKSGVVGSELEGMGINRKDPETLKRYGITAPPGSKEANLALLDAARKERQNKQQTDTTPSAEVADDHGKEMLDQLNKDVETINSQTPSQTTPTQAGVGIMRDAEGKKTRLRKAIPNELAGIANAIGGAFGIKELGYVPGTKSRLRREKLATQYAPGGNMPSSFVSGGTMSESLNNFKSTFAAVTEQELPVEDTMEELTDEQIQEAKMLSIKETVGQYKGNMREDVDALFNGESLSEEFRVKATLIFESAVTSRVEAIVEQIMNDNEEVLANAYEEIRDELTEQVDEYLNYVVDQWMGENQVAIETGLRSELAEDFITGLRALFQEHYIEIPEEKVDVAETLADELAQTQEYIEAQNVALNDLQEELNLVKKEKAINAFCEGLTAVQAGKMKSLAESVEFTTEGDFEEKLAVLRENYFPTKVHVKSEVKELQQVALNEEPEVAPTNNIMNRYVQAIAKTAPKA